VGADKLPVTGRPFEEIFSTAEQSGLVRMMREVCCTAQPQHLKGFDFRELGVLERGRAGETSRWDWEIYPLRGPTGKVSHLLTVVMDVTEPPSRRGRISPEARQSQDRRREAASGLLRIFGVASEAPGQSEPEPLTEREHQVADLVALGLSNPAIARRLHVRTTTVSSHVANILAKLAFRSRVQVAGWVVEQRLRAMQPAESRVMESAWRGKSDADNAARS